MATSPFVLSSVDIVNWQGKAGDTVTIKVVPKNTTTTITLANVFYPDTTSIPHTGDTAQFKVVSGPHDLTVSIQPRTVPPIIWEIVEVGTDKTEQTLARVNDPTPQQDPYSRNVRIIGVA